MAHRLPGQILPRRAGDRLSVNHQRLVLVGAAVSSEPRRGSPVVVVVLRSRPQRGLVVSVSSARPGELVTGREFAARRTTRILYHIHECSAFTQFLT